MVDGCTLGLELGLEERYILGFKLVIVDGNTLGVYVGILLGPNGVREPPPHAQIVFSAFRQQTMNVLRRRAVWLVSPDSLTYYRSRKDIVNY